MNDCVMTPVPKDHPCMQAWQFFKESEDFQRNAKHVLNSDYTEGALWFAFLQGWNRACLQLENNANNTKA